MASTPGDKAKYRRLRHAGVSHDQAVAMSASTPNKDFGGAAEGATAYAESLNIVAASATLTHIPTGNNAVVSGTALQVANGRIEVLAAGIYLVQPVFNFPVTAAEAAFRADLFPNISATNGYAMSVNIPSLAADSLYAHQLSYVRSAVAGDYFRLMVRQYSGVSKTGSGWLQVTKVG